MPPSPEIYISFDIESDGPYPGRYSMLAFGAVACMRREGNSIVKFDIDDERNQFYSTLRPVTKYFVQSAVEICKQGGVDRDELLVSGLHPSTVMVNFFNWLNEISNMGASQLIGVSFPAWDVQWMYGYLEEYLPHNPNREGLNINPFGHSRYLDVKSYYSGKYGASFSNSIKGNMPKRLRSKRKHTHNGLDDAIEQAELFCNIVTDNSLDAFAVPSRV